MNEFKYYDIPSPFPTLARGVFTMDVSEREDGVKHRIVARGYDKFFNIGEVPWTTVRAFRAIVFFRLSKTLVGSDRETYCGSLHAFSQVKRMCHFHRGIDAEETPHHV